MSAKPELRNSSDVYELIGSKWDHIIVSHTLSASLVQVASNYVLFWNLLKHQTVPEALILQKTTMNPNEDWSNSICTYQVLKEKFIRDNKDNLNIIDWEAVSINQKLTEAFITEMGAYVDWSLIANHQTLSEAFCETNLSKLSLSRILSHQVVSETFINDHLAEFTSLDWLAIAECQTLSMEFIVQNYEALPKNMIARNQVLAMDFIELHKADFSIGDLVRKQNLSAKFVRENKDRMGTLEWVYATMHSTFTVWENAEFLEEGLIDWGTVCQYQVLTEDFIRTYKDKVNWYHIITCQTISDIFKEEFRSYWEKHFTEV